MPFFPPGSGGTAIPWENLGAIYASPDGNDSNNGTGWSSPKQTIYAAIEALNTNAGGGTVYIADGCTVGGPVTGQGIRLRADFLGNDHYVFDLAPGFQTIQGPLRLCGMGGIGEGTPGFFLGQAARFIGGGDSPFNPQLWVVGFTAMHTLVIEGLENYQQGVTSARIGIDYDRQTSGALKDVTVTNATRTGTDTVFTVSLANALNVTKGSRTSNVTELTVDSGGLPFPAFRKNVPIVFTSGDVDFASGAYVISSMDEWRASINANYEWVIRYSETGADVPEKSIAASSLKTHGCCAGELIDLTSNTDDFLGTQYWVDSVNADGLHITVTDIFGNGDQNDNNIGTINHQERFYGGTNNVQLRDCSFTVDSANPLSYHGIDIGNCMAMWPQILNCCYSGTVGPYPSGVSAYDMRRMAGVYVYSGTSSHGPPASSLYMRSCSGGNGPIFIEVNTAQGSAFCNINGLLVETSITALHLPAIQVDGNTSTSVYTEDIYNADALTSDSTVILNSVQPAAAQCIRSGFVEGACVGGDFWQIPGGYRNTSPLDAPWTVDHITAWADGRITGKHPAAARAMGVLAARFNNVLLSPADWGLNGSTRTAGQDAPDGSATAYKITSAGGYVHMLPTLTMTDTWEVGGRFVVCGWVKVTDATAFTPNELFRITTTGVTFEDGISYPCPYTGTGWQFVSGIKTVATVSDSTPDIEVETLGTNAKDIYYWGMSAFYVPTSVLANDAFEMAGTLKHQPVYLKAGMSGTMEGGKLIAHGGIGTNSANANTVGVGSGQLTLTGTGTVYLPTYDVDGTTIVGWVAQLQATVNP